MSSQFINPITTTFALLEDYKNLVRRNLTAQGLPAEAVDHVVESLALDQKLYFTINRTYQQGLQTFRQFCVSNDLSTRLADCFHKFKRLYRHQEDAVQSILKGKATIVSTGTGSGKTEAFLIPILDYCLKHPGDGVKAIIIYPMNALANDQLRRIQDAANELQLACAPFTGATPEDERDAIRLNPPDILITNYVMLEWMLTRAKDQVIFKRSRETLRYIVLDEIHTYRGSKATHLKYLLARLRARFMHFPVQIGTSATLQKGHNNQEDSGSSASERFIKNLLGVDEFTFIQPVYVPEETPESQLDPVFCPQDTNSLDWQLDANVNGSLRTIGLLLGKRYSSFDLAGSLSESPLYTDLQSSSFVRAMRATLINQGAQTFTEFVRLFYRLSGSEGVESGHSIVKAYLSALSFLNHLLSEAKEAPLLDFRIHLFISDLGGHLKRCLRCHRYHSGRQEFCQECGFPLFHVSKDDLNVCIGKLSQNRLRWELKPRSDDRKNSYYVLIHLQPDVNSIPLEGSPTFAFDGLVRPDDGEIELSYHEHGEYTLQALPIVEYGKIEKWLIPLVDEFYSHEYLFTLVSSWLNFQPAPQKKLLGFVDSRARANRYASILRDEFASRFFYEFLRLHFPMVDGGAPIALVYARLKQAVAATNMQTKLEKALFDEIELWYWRLLSTSPRKAGRHQDLLSIRGSEHFSLMEQELLSIFLQERAIHKPLPQDLPQTNEYIRFRLYLVEQYTGIYCTGGEASNASGYQSVSLSQQGRIYREFVDKYTEDAIQETLEDLVARGVLVQNKTPDAKLHYYLNADFVLFNAPPEQMEEYAVVRRDFLLTSNAHSSESRKREELENAFKEGEVQCLIATPTLEMGIDIGDLQGVLMLGVPPEPSNYVQRAGRAGRGQYSSAATVVTFCRENSPHDQIFYATPKDMIDGSIKPPLFDPENWEVKVRHVHAFLLTPAASSVNEAATFLRRFPQEVELHIARVREVLGAHTTLETYLRQHFPQVLRTQIERYHGGSFQSHLYNSGFFPDYGFRRDAIYVLDAKAMRAKGIDPGHPTAKPMEELLQEYALGERHPEQAYLDLLPGTPVYMSDNIYTLATPPVYESFRLKLPGAVDLDPVAVRSYDYLMGEEEILYAREDEKISRYDRLLLFHTDQPYVDRKHILQTAYDPACTLYFINRGERQPENDIKHFSDKDEEYSFGYRLERESLILRFAGDVCGDNEIPISFASALYSALLEHYEVDASEVGLLFAAHSLQADSRNSFHVVFYDRTGNKSLPFAKIQDQFGEIVEATYRRVTSCPSNAESRCNDGCYRCCKSYSLGYWSGAVKRSIARMVAGYLLGAERFVPDLPEPKEVNVTFDLELNVRDHGDHFMVQSSTHNRYETPKGTSYNRSMIDALIRAIRAEWSPNTRRLRITSKLTHLVDAINEGSIKKEREHFSHLQFELLRFESVVAEIG